MRVGRFGSALGVALCLAGSAAARSVPRPLVRQAPSSTAAATGPQSTACGDLIDAVDQGQLIFAASDAFLCLQSVPFHAEVALRFLTYWNETLQFQSTLGFLKNPPAEYQQPGVDVLQGLDTIKQRVLSGHYRSEYAFEADVQLLVNAMHDYHVSLTSGILSAFSFASPLDISSVSSDGVALPKIYITDDIIASKTQKWKPSAVKSINGVDVLDFLADYCDYNAFGNVEGHADWNQLMAHPALDIQGLLTTWAGAGRLYPGENLTYVFENGTAVDTIWVAIYNNQDPTGPLTTGGDFYNYFVLGLLPASVPSETTPGQSQQTGQESPQPSPTGGDAEPTPSALPSWFEDSNGAYPNNPDVVQDDLSISGGGVVTGYFLNDSSTGVLSIPSFDQVEDSVETFSDAVQEFIDRGRELRINRVIIDLQQNTGGAVLLALDTFKRFFPDLVPFAGSRRRSQELGNIVGASTTAYFQSLTDQDDIQQFAGNEWVITERLNAATNRNFTSWQEYQGPLNINGDSLTLTERYDLANPTFDASAFDGWIPTGYLPDAQLGGRPWSNDQIVLITDGLCSSACTLFQEMMNQDAGVRSVVMGGLPVTGPMQSASGSRGAAAYSADLLDGDLELAGAVNETANVTLPQVRDAAIYTLFAGFNLRDQVRANDAVPLQFRFDAADCRLYYTLANLYNLTRLWHDVATAAFDDPSRCVQGSVGYSTRNSRPLTAPAPVPAAKKPGSSPPLGQNADFDDDPTGGIVDGKVVPPRGDRSPKPCASQGACQTGTCTALTVRCPSGKSVQTKACLAPCENRQGNGACPGVCNIQNAQESKQVATNGKPAVPFGNQLRTGLCYPAAGNKELGCV